MTPKEASEIIGCSPQQVRTLIRSGKLRATKIKAPGGRHSYDLSKRVVNKYRDQPQSCGYPRGKRRKP